MPIEKLRRYGALCRDDSTIPERIALLEEHAAAVRHEIEELLRQQARLDEKVAWYRRQLQEDTGARLVKDGG